MSDGNKVVVELEVEAKTAVAVKELAKLEKGIDKASDKARELGQLQSKESVQAAAAATEAQRKYQLQLEINRARVENMADAQRKANAEAQRAAAAQGKAAAAAEKLAAAQSKASAAHAAAGAGMDKVATKHGPNMTKTLQRVGFAAHQVAGQTASFNSILNGILSTLGPWGIVVGAAAGALLHFAGAADEAHKKLVQLNDERRKQAGLDREKEQDFQTNALLQRRRLNAEKDSETEEKNRRQIAENYREERDALEELVIFQEARGKSAEGARRRQAELREETLREQGAISGFEKQQELYREADAVAREEKLRRLEAEGKHEKAITNQKKEQFQWDAERRNLLTAGKNAGAFDRASGDTREFAAGMAEAKQGETLSGMQRAAPEKSPWEIEREQIALTREVEESHEQWSKERHEAELQRIADKQARQQAAGAVIGDSVTGLATTMVQAGLSGEKGFKRMLASWGKTESIKLTVMAITEGVRALVSLATYDFGGAALHAAAAAAAGAQAVVVAAITGAVGGFAGSTGTKTVSGALTGSDFGGGPAGPAANDRPSTTNSQSDTVPVSPQEAAQQAGNSGSSRSGGNVIVGPGAITVLGAIDDKAAMKIAQGLRRVERTAGKTGS